MIKTVAVYLRISRDKGEGIDTLQNHRERLTLLCREREYNIIKIYEEVISGQAKMESREELNLMLSELHQYDAIVVVSIDRLSRDLEYSINIFKQLEKAGVPVVTPERIYYENDFTLFAIESTLAHGEYKAIRKRMLQGKYDGARRGEWIHRTPPIGYVRGEDKKLVIEPKGAEIVKQIFSLAESGYGAPAIAKRLTGHRTAMGKPFTVNAVLTILNNQTYLGHITFNANDKRGNTETITCKEAHEPIINKEQFNQVQSALQARYVGDRVARSHARGATISILKDLVYCQCGLKLRMKKDNKQASAIYLRACKCGNKGLNEKVLLELFIKEFNDYQVLFSWQIQKALEMPITDNKEVLEQQVKELQKTADKLSRRLEGYAEMRADGEITRELYQKKKAETEDELAKASDKIEELKSRMESLDKQAIINCYESKLKLIKQFNDSSDLEESNRLLKLLIHKVEYYRSENHIDIYIVEKTEFMREDRKHRKFMQSDEFKELLSLIKERKIKEANAYAERLESAMG
jgi:site-specific DNA recombinase